MQEFIVLLKERVMEKRLRIWAALFMPFLLLALFTTGCGSAMFKNVVPKKDAKDVEFLPTFSWQARKPVKDLQFELYRAVDFRIPTKQAVGQPILKITNFSQAPDQAVPLSNLDILAKKFRAEGVFLTQGYDSLEPNKDYVWVLRATGPEGAIVEVYKFHTRMDYYRPD
jgi:hypothetical protein